MGQAGIQPAASCRGAVPGLGAGRGLLYLSTGPCRSPALVADGAACWSPSRPLGPAFPPSSRKRWHLAFMERSRCCVTFTFICHPGCVLPSLREDDRLKQPALDSNPHHLRYLHSHLSTCSYQNPFGLWLSMMYCFCDEE